jgi:hypothetical protein
MQLSYGVGIEYDTGMSSRKCILSCVGGSGWHTVRSDARVGGARQFRGR